MFKKFYAVGGHDTPWRLTPKKEYYPVAIRTEDIDHIQSEPTGFRWVTKEDSNGVVREYSVPSSFGPLLVVKSLMGISNISVDARMDELIGCLNSDGEACHIDDPSEPESIDNQEEPRLKAA